MRASDWNRKLRDGDEFGLFMRTGVGENEAAGVRASARGVIGDVELGDPFLDADLTCRGSLVEADRIFG